MKRVSGWILLGCLVWLGFAAPSLHAAVELNVTSPYMDKHPVVVNGFLPWFKEVERQSGGSLKLVYFNPGTLCPDGEVGASLATGAIDIGAHSALRTAGTFPRTGAQGLQLISPGGESGANLAWEIYTTMPSIADEFSRFHLLAFWAGGAENIHTIKTPVRSLEDLKGLKLIVWSPTGMETAKALGAVPIQQSPPDTYMALQRGMADGVICPVAPMQSYKLDEVVRYTTVARLYAAPFYLGMSNDAFKRLSPEQREVIEKTSGKLLGEQCGRALDNGERSDLETMKGKGLEVIELQAAERERWKAAVQPLHEKWITDNEVRGVKDARATYNSVTGIANKLFPQGH